LLIYIYIPLNIYCSLNSTRLHFLCPLWCVGCLQRNWWTKFTSFVSPVFWYISKYFAPLRKTNHDPSYIASGSQHCTFFGSFLRAVFLPVLPPGKQLRSYLLCLICNDWIIASMPLHRFKRVKERGRWRSRVAGESEFCSSAPPLVSVSPPPALGATSQPGPSPC
jgi:hypothetical protein